MGILATGSIDNRRDPKHLRWFLIGGGAGLVEAIILAIMLSHDAISGELLARLWPSSIVMLTDAPSIFVLIFGYGGNFVLYGLAALLFSLFVQFIRDFLPQS